MKQGGTLKRGFQMGRLFILVGLALWAYQWISGDTTFKLAISLLWGIGVLLLGATGLLYFARTGKLRF